MTAPVLLHPTSELVCRGWLLQVDGIDYANTTLPKDTSSWSTGFAQLVVISGNVDPYLPVRTPIYQISCWAVNPNSANPPWGKALQLAECIRAATYLNRPVEPALPNSYGKSRVTSAYLNTEPRRINSESTSYARFDLELILHWIEVPS